MLEAEHTDSAAEIRYIPVYDAGFNLVADVTKATIHTLLPETLGLAGSIAYVDEGAKLYEEFKRSTLPEHNPAGSEVAQLINTHKDTLVKEIEDIERLIIVGGGSFDSILNQELLLLKHLFSKNPRPKLKEIVLQDISEEFLSDQVKAVQHFENEHGVRFDIRVIRGEFKKISPQFDAIMTQHFGSKSREEVKAAVIMTGGTFGNLEGLASTNRFPGKEIDRQMAYLADFVGNGSTVILDHFSDIEKAVAYYGSGKLDKFFENIPSVMRQYCKGLVDFFVNGDKNRKFFEYNVVAHSRAGLIGHELIVKEDQSPKIVNGTNLVLPLQKDEPLSMMFSLRAEASAITSRPSENTGLASTFHATDGDLVIHAHKRVGVPAILHQKEMTFGTAQAMSDTTILASSLNKKPLERTKFRPAHDARVLSFAS
jgi:hypothetical protein